jgi:hypothetical protein
MEPKRRALDGIATRQREADEKRKMESEVRDPDVHKLLILSEGPARESAVEAALRGRQSTSARRPICHSRWSRARLRAAASAAQPR